MDKPTPKQTAQTNHASSLYDKEEYFRLLAESSLTGIYLLQNNNFIYVNKAFATMFGYTVEEVLTELKIIDLVAPIDRHLVEGNIRKREEGEKESIRYSFHGMRKDGSHNYIEVHGTRIQHKGKPAVMGTLIDRTEIKQAEDSLKISQFIFNAASIGIFLVNKNAEIIDVNQHACKTLGYTKDELTALTVYDIDPTFTKKKFSELQEEKAATPTVTIETIHQKRTGETYPVQVLLSKIPYNDEDITVSFVQDISKRKEAQLQQEKIEEQFRQVQKMESIGRLAGGVAHDLNNLLTPIIGYVGLLYRDPSLQERGHNQLGQIEKAAIGARDLVAQLLAFSRKQVLEYKPQDLNVILTGYEKLIRRTIREDIEIQMSMADDVKLAMLDKGQIEQILLNLVVNASDAMVGGGKLTIATQMASLDETYVSQHHGVTPGQYVMLSVSDTGIGMDDKTMAKIFEPFYSTKGIKGTGLGLATVYGIVKQHNGNIWVYSEIDKGTTFKVYLPVANYTDVQEETQTDEDKEQTTKPTETILVVEDNEAVRDTVVDIFTEEGYQVTSVENGAKAIESIASGFNPELLLTDIIMPNMSGTELVTMVQEQLPDIKHLYMSGYTDDAIVHHGVLNDGVHFIQKPFTSKTLLKKIREVLHA